MDRKSPKPPPKRPDPERKSPNNLILYAAIFGMATLLAVGGL